MHVGARRFSTGVVSSRSSRAKRNADVLLSGGYGAVDRFFGLWVKVHISPSGDVGRIFEIAKAASVAWLLRRTVACVGSADSLLLLDVPPPAP